MRQEEKPFIPAEKQLPEITVRVILLAIFLSIILATSNAFLALKIGMLTSASIPAALLSMGILRLCKDANILENNLVQTAASAGEAVAGGIVYTVPALILIHYWGHFSYWENFIIALIGGVLGVMFSVPLRYVLVSEPTLRFPEGRAIAEVLKMSSEKVTKLTYMIWGGAAGALIELAQTGFKLIANSWQVWFVAQRTVYGFGTGFSATMIGAGYLIGFDLGLSIMIGAVVGWLITVPALAEYYPHYLQGHDGMRIVVHLWNEKIRYIGIGAMLLAGMWTLFSLLKPFYASLQTSMRAMQGAVSLEKKIIRTEYDMPMQYILLGLFLGLLALTFYFAHSMPVSELHLGAAWSNGIIAGAVFYVLVIGFICAAITAYFSGLVGVTASPGSAIIIASMLLAAVILFLVIKAVNGFALSHSQIMAAEAITIMVGAVITSAAAISNDNMQDLKVGHLVGSTPWKQQIMLLLGVLVSSLVIPPVMELLFNVYGIGDVLPHPGMDPASSLAAPPAALMAAITKAVFHQSLPWDMLGVGAAIIAFVIVLNTFLKNNGFELSILGLAIGIYLPLASSTPLFIGSLFALLTRKKIERTALSDEEGQLARYPGTLLACGLVAGSALMDVALAIPFSLLHSPDALRIVSAGWAPMAAFLGLVMTVSLGTWFYRIVK